MSAEQISNIKNLMSLAGGEKEVVFGFGNTRLRVDLRDDDISLWQHHLAAQSAEANLLLACENSNGDLSETRLTWIVGAAIRSSLVTGNIQATDLLKMLDVQPQLLSLVTEHCTGLGESTVWAFHLDRNGTLTATPVSS